MGGNKLSEAERKRTSLLGILTPVGDDLFDVDKLDTESIKHIALNPENYSPELFTAKVAKEIQSYELKHVLHKKEYLEASKNVVEIQIETILQTNPQITIKEIERITIAKGGWSITFYHQALDEIADEKLKDVLLIAGGLFQLGNDVFDCYKDVQDNINTLVTRCDDFFEFRNEFIERVRTMNTGIMNLPYPEKNKKEFCIVMNSINARSLVAIDRFICLQKKTGAKISWNSVDRKYLICDMEKPANVLRWFYNIYFLSRLK